MNIKIGYLYIYISVYCFDVELLKDHVGVIPTHTQRKRSNKERMTKKLANEIVLAEYPKKTTE